MAIVGLDLSTITGSKRRNSFIEEIDELQNKHFEYSVFEDSRGKIHRNKKYDFDIAILFIKGKRVCDIKELFSDCEFSLQKGKYLCLRIVQNSSKVCDDLRSLFPPIIRCNNKNGEILLFYNLDLIDDFEFKDSFER
jgi:hypothetical protein